MISRTSMTLLAIVLLLIAVAVCPANAQVSTVGFSVKDTGAVGDGKADDTAAFEKALVKAKELGVPVIVPQGTYKLTKTLTVRAQSLTGAVTGAWGADEINMPVIQVEGREGPCVRVEAGGAVHGFQFNYDWKGQDPSPAPPTIEVAGVGCRVSEVKIFGAWDAIMTDGETNAGRSIIEKCFIVDVHNIGVRMTPTWDVTWISKVEVWSPGSKTFPAKGIGFQFGKNDVLLVSDCFAFRAHAGYQFVDDIEGCKIKGGTWGSFTNCTADFSAIGTEIKGNHTVNLSSCTMWTHWGGLAVREGKSEVRISGCEFAANGGPAVTIEGGKLLTIGTTQMRRDSQSFNAPALRITGGKDVLITGNIITSSVKAIDLKEGMDIVMANNIVRENVKSDEEPANTQSN